MVMDYVEELSAGNPRHAAMIQLKTGVKRDGTIVAHQARVVFDSGAYGGFKPVPTVNLGGAAKAGGPYKIPHVHIESVQVYTNTIPGGFMRAPGEPQAVFAIESHIDCIARQLGRDPWLTDKTYQARSMSYVYIGPMEGRRVHPDACHRASMVPQALSSLRRNHGEHTLSV